MQKEVCEEDFRRPEFRHANPADYEFRSDGAIVRKDRWEQGMRRLVSVLGMDSREFEIDDVVLYVSALVAKLPVENGDEDAIIPAEMDDWLSDLTRSLFVGEEVDDEISSN